MLIPKKTKYRFSHRTSHQGKAKGNKKLVWGEYGLQAQQGAWIKSNQIEAVRKVIVRFTRKGGEMRINIFPHLPRTKKPLEVRMGSGKGSVDHWAAVVKKGTIMFELRKISRELAHQALRAASYKLPVECQVVEKISS